MTITVDFSQLHHAAHATWTAIGRLATSTNTQTWADQSSVFVTAVFANGRF